jgi:glycosyltransferase involved in cell wall biosynthesis
VTEETHPIIAIIIPTRNRLELARRAVASGLAQTVQPVEIVVIDDGSDVPFTMEEKDHRVRIIRNERSIGGTAARNMGLGAASADWITFLDDDDELLPSMVEESLRAAERSSLPQPVAAVTGVELVDENGCVIATRYPVPARKGGHYFLDVWGVSREVANTLVVQRDVFRSIGAWDAEIPASREHLDLFLRVNAACSLEAIEVVGARKHLHAGTHVRNDLLAAARAMERTLEKHRDTFAQHRRFRAHYLGTLGITYLRAGRWGRAVAATTRSITTYPFRPRLVMWWAASLGGPRALHLRRKKRSSNGRG